MEPIDNLDCAICLNLAYKPVVLGCGHLFCFHCCFQAMSKVTLSRCACCRTDYGHFPGISQRVHFYLLENYPEEYRIREKGALEIERDLLVSSPTLDQITGMNPISQLICVGCNHILLDPVIRHCGHVYCDRCLGSTLSCELYDCVQAPGGATVCLRLAQFLESQTVYDPERLVLERGVDPRRLDRNKYPSDIYSEFINWLQTKWRNYHPGIGCDRCGMFPIFGARYKCLDCQGRPGYDLCGNCILLPPVQTDHALIPEHGLHLNGRFHSGHNAQHRFYRMRSHLSVGEGQAPDVAQRMQHMFRKIYRPFIRGPNG